jgi:hypothetical protein
MVETWKVLAGLAGLTVTFGVIASVLGVELTPPVVVGLIVVTVVISAINYAMFKRSYRVGRQLGGDDGDGES